MADNTQNRQAPPKRSISQSHKIKIVGTGYTFEDNENISRDDVGSYINKVVGEIPDQLQISLEPNWDTPITTEAGQQLKAFLQNFQSQINNLIDSNIDVAKYLNMQKGSLWAYMGQSPIQLSLQIKFRAEDDVYKDIVKPVKTLMRMASPVGEGISLAGGNIGFYSRPDAVDVRIGNLVYLQDALITNVSPSIEKPFLADDKSGYYGIPSIVEVAVSFTTRYGAVWGTKLNDVPDVRDILFF